MQVVQFEESGKTKRIERRVFIRCRAPGCGSKLECPDSADEWAWLKCAEVATFRALHIQHGPVGAHLEFIEKD